MPADPEPTIDRYTPVFVCSGGGLRATLLDCGALMRLNELGDLTTVTRISSVSGGSVAICMLAAARPRLTVEDGVITDLLPRVIESVRAFCRRSADTIAVEFGAFLPGKSVGDVLADLHAALFAGMTLPGLPNSPQIVFNAINLQTGRLVWIQKSRLSDYTLGEIANPIVRLAVAVAASGAFPPVGIQVKPDSWVKLKGAVHFGGPKIRGSPRAMAASTTISAWGQSMTSTR